MNTPLDPVAIEADVWTRLAAGQKDRAHPFYLPAVAVTGLDGRPTVRTVVLRHVDRAAGLLSFQTDRRSPKCAAIGVQPVVAWLFYDAAARIQLRISTTADIHTDDNIADEAWAAVPLANQSNYRTEHAPGTVIPTVYRSSSQWRAEGRENFAVVNCAVQEVDWLMLHPDGHRRLRVIYGDLGPAYEWLAP